MQISVSVSLNFFHFLLFKGNNKSLRNISLACARCLERDFFSSKKIAENSLKLFERSKFIC